MSNTNRGPYIQTRTGRHWYPFDPKPEDVCLEDLEACARVCRYGGSPETFYSVAEHCVRVALAMRDAGHNATLQFAGLLHDAHESYPPSDVPGPLKSFNILMCPRDKGGLCQAFQEAVTEMEAMAAHAVQMALTGDPHFCTHPEVKHFDLKLLATERRDLMIASNVDWGSMPEPLPEPIIPMSPTQAWCEWVRLFRELKTQVELDDWREAAKEAQHNVT